MATLLYPLLTVALLCLSAAKEMGLNREKRQASSVCDNYVLNRYDTIRSLETCETSVDNPSRYPNGANWTFTYYNEDNFPAYVNIHCIFNIESHDTCSYDSLSFGTSSNPRQVVLCGTQEQTFSIELQPFEEFLMNFRSDYSQTGDGFNISYSIDPEAFYSTSNLPMYLNGSPPQYYGGYTSDSYSTDNYNYYPYTTDNYQYPEYPQVVDPGFGRPYWSGNQDDSYAAKVETLRVELEELKSCLQETQSALQEVERIYYNYQSGYQQPPYYQPYQPYPAGKK